MLSSQEEYASFTCNLDPADLLCVDFELHNVVLFCKSELHNYTPYKLFEKCTIMFNPSDIQLKNCNLSDWDSPDMQWLNNRLWDMVLNLTNLLLQNLFCFIAILGANSTV